MSYVAIKGGAEAIRASKQFLRDEVRSAADIGDEQLIRGLRFACDRVISEGALYSEKLAAEAVRRSGGDLLEAAFYLRAHRSTCQRIGTANRIDTGDLRILRRISSAFKDIEGGQILGPSSDYVIRLFASRAPEAPVVTERDDAATGHADIFAPSALQSLRDDDLVIELADADGEPFDVTRSFPLPPYPRSGVMQVMARGETGSLLAFAYTSMRGYGDVHPTIGDLRLGWVELRFAHPFSSRLVTVGTLRLTACETVGTFVRDRRDGALRLAVGFGLCFGFNETKAIAMSILDLAMNHPGYSVGGAGIATSPEMIIHHVDAIESMGFTNHFKLPHYVTFQADLQVFGAARERGDE
jgi:alpha-D-ribose 1-methylphosphonate 5-triphosphate synthase subunit PhnI